MLRPFTKGRVELDGGDDAYDIRGPRILEWAEPTERRDSVSRAPTLRRRMSGDKHVHHNSLSKTPTTPIVPPMASRESFDARSDSTTRERLNSMRRSENFDQTNNMTRNNTTEKGEAFDRTNSIGRTNTIRRRESFGRTGSMARMNAVGRRDWERSRKMVSFDTRQSMGMPPPVMMAEKWV